MSYKIVQFNKKPGRIELMAVPSGWVVGTNKLYLPDKNVNLLSKEPRSLPNIKWRQFNCTLKRANLPCLSDVLAELNNMERISDTADEETAVYQPTQKQILKTRISSNVVSNADDGRYDFNNMVSITHYYLSVYSIL